MSGFPLESGRVADIIGRLRSADFVEKVVDDLWEQ
jgi:hypothetical protein